MFVDFFHLGTERSTQKEDKCSDAHSKNYPDFDASLTPSTVKNAMDVNWSQIVNKLNEELQKKSATRYGTVFSLVFPCIFFGILHFR